jgi:hypothetical protein
VCGRPVITWEIVNPGKWLASTRILCCPPLLSPLSTDAGARLRLPGLSRASDGQHGTFRSVGDLRASQQIGHLLARGLRCR